GEARIVEPRTPVKANPTGGASARKVGKDVFRAASTLVPELCLGTPSAKRSFAGGAGRGPERNGVSQKRVPKQSWGTGLRGSCTAREVDSRRLLPRPLQRQQGAVLPGRRLLDRLDVDGDLDAGQGSPDGLLDPAGQVVGLPHAHGAGHQEVEVGE